MNDKQCEVLRKELEAIKRLLALLLKENNVRGNLIAKAMGVTGARLSQILPQKKYKKRKK